MKLKNRTARSSLLMAMPMYVFTILFTFGPLIYMFALSFMRRQETWGVINEFYAGNYLRILEPVISGVFAESFKLALITTFFVTAFGYPFGYFMAKLPPKHKNRAMLLMIVPFWTNSLMRLYGWIIIFRSNGILDSLLIALRLSEKPLRLLYTYPAVVVGMVYVLLPFMIYSVYSSAEKLDWSLVEAARDLGATKTYAFLTISLRLTMPGLLSGIILTFIPSMGLYFIADILGGNKVALVGSLIQEQLLKARDWPFAAALSVALMAATSLTLYLYRRITRSEDLEGLV
jgi:spermidine/putrescine transport system permease protein